LYLINSIILLDNNIINISFDKNIIIMKQPQVTSKGKLEQKMSDLSLNQENEIDYEKIKSL